MMVVGLNTPYYGKEEALPERVALQAGPLTLFWEEGDLRTVKFQGREVLRRVYVATRDRNWSTVPNVISNLKLERGDVDFAITFDVTNRQGEIDFTWQATITGSADGVIRYAMDGVAHTTFLKNRIGFCILHPAEAAGARCRIEHVDATTEEAALPVFIRADQPVKPFAEMAALTHALAPEVWAEVRFEGDIFEMEDQRNWTDASFKTFCTPLRLPYPVEIEAGTRIFQAIEMRVQGPHAAPPAASTVPAAAPVVTVGPLPEAPRLPLPPLGLGVASHDEPLTGQALALLRALNLHHLRVDIRPLDPQAPARLARATAEANALGIGLEVAVLLSAPPDAELPHLAELLAQVRPPVTAWLVFPTPEIFWGGSPTAEVVAAAQPVLKAYAPGAPLGSGTNADFIFLQRNLPPLDAVDFLAYAINPQVHAFDNLSLVETLACQAATVASARQLSGGKPIYASPVTLKMRHNPYATAAPPPVPPGELPPQVDVRQVSLFGAGWTLGSLKYLAEGGAASVTGFETTGWRGVMECAAGSPVPAKFASIPGGVFPLYHVLADVGEFAGGKVLPSLSDDPLAVDILMLRKDGRTSTLVANLTPDERTVAVNGLSPLVRVRLLAAGNTAQAMGDPSGFRAGGRQLATDGGALVLSLPPFATARIDAVGQA